MKSKINDGNIGALRVGRTEYSSKHRISVDVKLV